MQIKKQIRALISQIDPMDDIESAHMEAALDWIDSGAEIFRIERPATPPKHLVCYTVLVDKQHGKLLLLEHKNAQLLLPNGGHLDKDELPIITALRELKEEMGERGKLLFQTEVPFFVSEVETVGKSAGHTDVDLWYVFERDSDLPLNDDTEEFKSEFGKYYWLTFAEVLNMNISKLDPHMHRFMKKLMQALGV